MALEIVKTGCALGAELRGVDLTQRLEDDMVSQIRLALLEHEVIYFRGQMISDEDQIRFSSYFGGLRRLKRVNALHRRLPEIFLVSNILENGEPIGLPDAGIFWHTDGAYLESLPFASVLRAIEVPHQDGKPLGDTVFASMTAAYDALPGAMKKRLDGLRAVQSISLRYEKTEKIGIRKGTPAAVITTAPEAIHPVVRAHPVTRRKCIFVSQGYTKKILDIPDQESEELIAELAAYCVEPRFQYRHSYQVDDLVMWDDSSTQHKATFDYALPQRRLMHRTTIGDLA